MSLARNYELDMNNRRIRQLIEQFNAEEAYYSALHSAMEEMCKLLASDGDLAEAIAALRKWRSTLRNRPTVNAIGFCVENRTQAADIRLVISDI